jgi:hypothetical protein
MRAISRASYLANTNLLLFLLMSLIWGATWIAIKAGLAAVPPVFFAGTRYALVALILVVFVHDLRAFADRRLIGRILVSGLLVNTGTYALLFWGMQFVESGMSGLVNLSLVPVGLFILSVLFKDEKPRGVTVWPWLSGQQDSRPCSPARYRQLQRLSSGAYWPSSRGLSATVSERCCRAPSCCA